MSYLVLARKWRPKGFDDLIGQEPISRILSNAIEQGKIAHAYLFSGPRGVGKTSTARILAKAMNCETGPTPSPCGACASCRGIADGSSVDVMEIDGASNNSVNDIRDLRERVKYAPAGGRYKVYIIDEAHMLSDAAFNALLKTLEEPPTHVIFVLATTAPRKIPATVLSRCQHLPFKKIPMHLIKERLRKITASEGITISDSAVEMVARASEGSMRDSLTILDQVSAFSSDIKESEVKDLLGIADFSALSALSSAVIRGDRPAIIRLIGELTDRGTDLKSFTKDLMQFFRDLLVAKVVNKPGEMLDMNEHELQVVTEILTTATEDHLILLLSEMIKAESEVRIAFSPRVALEMSLIRASFLNDLKPVKEAIEHLETYLTPDQKGHSGVHDRVERPGIVQSSPDKGEETPLPEESLPVADDALLGNPPLASGEGFRDLFMRKVDEVHHPLACKLSQAVITLDDNTLLITFHGGIAVHADSVKKHQEVLEQAAAEILGRKISVLLTVERKKGPPKKELKEKILSEPFVREAIDLFEGRIVDIRPKDTMKNGG